MLLESIMLLAKPNPKYFPKKKSTLPDSRKSTLMLLMGHKLNPRPGPILNEGPSISMAKTQRNIWSKMVLMEPDSKNRPSIPPAKPNRSSRSVLRWLKLHQNPSLEILLAKTPS